MNPNEKEFILTSEEIAKLQIDLKDIPEAEQILVDLQSHGGNIMLVAENYIAEHPNQVKLFEDSINTLNKEV